MALADPSPKSPPTYKLEVGQMFDFDLTSAFEHQGGILRRRGRWQIWVTDRHEDGRYRLVFRHGYELIQRIDDDDGVGGTRRILIGYCDMHPDGRIDRNPTLNLKLDPRLIFPLLPKSPGDQAWTETAPHNGFDYEFQTQVATPALITASVTRSFDQAYGMELDYTYELDPESNLPRKVTEKSKQAWGLVGEGSSELTLYETQSLSESDASEFGEAVTRYIQARENYQTLFDHALIDPKYADTYFDQALDALQAARSKITRPLVLEWLDDLIAGYEVHRTQQTESARRIERWLGKQMPEWQGVIITSEAGPSRLTLTPEPMALFFWHRGSVSSIRLAEQVRAIRDNEGIAILGLNAEADPAEAIDAVEAMNAVVPGMVNLEGHALAGHLDIVGFPTVVVIDAKRTIRAILPAYRKDLTARVKASLN